MMKKTNLKETLKQIVGVLLFGYVCIAEAVSTGCKKLRTLPKKVMALCIAATLVVAMVPAYVFAAEDHTHCICGATHASVGNHTAKQSVEWTAWDGTTSIPYTDNVAYIYLTNDIDPFTTLSIASDKTLYLCLNGHSFSEATNAIAVQSNAQLNICDCSDGTIGSVSSSVGSAIYNLGTVTVYSGILSGGNYGIHNMAKGPGVGTAYVYGGTVRGVANGIYVYANTTVTVSGGTVEATGDGSTGILNSRGTVNVTGGTIRGDSYGINGIGTFTLKGNPEITGNTAGIMLATGTKIDITGALTYTTPISVKINSSAGTGTFTNGGAAYIDKFVSCNNQYGIAVNGNDLEVKPLYTVTFNYGTLGSSETKTVFKGETVTPPTPVFAGKVLVGWYTNSNFSTKFDFDTPITAATTIYAKFADYEGDKKTLQDAIDTLEADVAELNKLTENGGAIDQINAKISAIESQIAALDALKDKYAEADTALKQELQASDAAINAAIAALTGRVDALEDEIDDLQTDVNGNAADIAENAAELAALNTSLTNLSNKLTNDYATKAELTSAINSAKDTINSAIDALTIRVQDLEAGLAAVNSKVDTNTSDVTALKSDVATLNTWKNEAQSAITALQTLTGTQGTEISRLKVAVQDLEAELAAAEARIDDAEDRIAVLEGKVSALETAKQNLDAAVAALNAAINNKADTATLNQKVTDLIAAIATAEDAAKTYADGKDTALQTQLTAAVATAKGEAITAAENLVNTAKAELQTAINNKADIATLNAKVAELNAAIATAEATAKAYTDSAVTTLNAAIITAKDEAVDAAKDLVDAAKAELQAAIDNKADTAAVNAAIANLQNAITALENAKDNYVSADAALKAELEAAIAKAKQEAIDAAKGHIPYIGTNGNWWIGDTDTGIDANGIKGDTGNGIASITTKKENGVTTVTITFTDPEKEPVVFTISDGETGATGADGVGVAKVEKTATNGNVDTYTITLTNGKTYTFTVTNGKDGADGKDGENGKDGLTPFIGENGNWWIGDTDTGVKAAADDSVTVGSGNVTEAEGVNTVTVVAIVIAGVALLGNVLLAVLVLKKKKSLV